MASQSNPQEGESQRGPAAASESAINSGDVSGKPKSVKARPLNSWIAFRVHYHNLFPGQQKHASTYLNILWQNDPFKPKWAVVAKTYTMIRDKVGKQMAPLDIFLQLACPKMGIVTVNDYLKLLNWNVTDGEDGFLKITQTAQPDLTTFDVTVVGCTMTHMDLLQFILDTDYLDEVDVDLATDVRSSATHMFAAAATMTPGQANVAFLTAARKDPKTMMAILLGIDIDHKYMEISATPLLPPMTAAESAAMNDFAFYLHPAIMPAPAPVPVQVPIYNWTGSMTELYQPNEMALDLATLAANHEFMVTDITDPAALDSFLEAVGYDPNDLNAGQFGAPNTMAYEFDDSF